MKFLVINEANSFVVNVTVGRSDLPGMLYVEQVDALRHVAIGWSRLDGKYVDTRSSYSPSKRWERTA